MEVFLFQKYSKFWSILLGHFIKHKPLISEECYTTIFTTIVRSTTLALSGKIRLEFRSKKCSCDELTRKITLIVFDSRVRAAETLQVQNLKALQQKATIVTINSLNKKQLWSYHWTGLFQSYNAVIVQNLFESQSRGLVRSHNGELDKILY